MKSYFKTTSMSKTSVAKLLLTLSFIIFFLSIVVNYGGLNLSQEIQSFVNFYTQIILVILAIPTIWMMLPIFTNTEAPKDYFLLMAIILYLLATATYYLS